MKKLKHLCQNINLNAIGVQVLDCHRVTVEEQKEWKFKRKELKGVKRFNVSGKTITHSSGAYIQALATWEGTVFVTDGHVSKRYRLLKVYHLDSCLHFAVPITIADSHPPLPEVNLGKTELKLIYSIAHELLGWKSRQETAIIVKSREKQEVKENRNLAFQLESSEEIVAKLLEENHWILTTLAEILLVNILPWISAHLVPRYHTAFLVSGGSTDVFCQTLGAFNLTGTDMPVLDIVTLDDMADWQAYGSKLTLINADRKMRKKLLKQVCKQPFVGHLFFLTSKKYDDMSYFHVSVPTNLAPLTEEQQDACRAFMAKLLDAPKKLAERVVGDYEKIMESPFAYRIKEAEAWHQVVEAIISEGLLEHCQAVKAAQDQRQDQEEQSQRMLDEAVGLILDPNRYMEGISSEWKKDKASVRAQLQELYALHKVDIKGKEYLSFSNESMMRLCRDKVGLPEEDFDILRGRLKSQCILEFDRQGKDTVSTWMQEGTNFRMFRIMNKKLSDYTITPISQQTEGEC